MSVTLHLPATIVAVAFFYNAVVGILGMNKTTWPRVAALIVGGLLLALFAGWLSIQQAQETKDTLELLRRVAIANGINPNQTTESLAEKTIKKQLGTEAMNLSDAIFAFLKDNNAFQSAAPRKETWDADIKREMEKSRKLVEDYNKEFLAKTLSLADRIEKTKVGAIDHSQMRTFENPTNPGGMQIVAATLGRLGNTLLQEAAENAPR